MTLQRLTLEKLWQKKWFRVSGLIGIWVFIGIVFSSQLYLFAMNSGMQTTVSYVLRWELTRWCLWAALTPWILRFVQRNPIRKPHLSSAIGKHLAGSILISLVHIVMFSLVHWVISLSIRAAEANGSFFNNLLLLFAQNIYEPLEIAQFIFPLDFHLGIFVYWLIVITMLTILFYKSATQLQLELTKAQLQALKMQINPHFLFNTLNSISTLLHKDPESADEMVGSLGDFLRMTLQNSGEEEVLLQKEMEFLKCYLEIEQIRFKDRLVATVAIGPGTAEAMVPNMLLQPIVENAMKHGIAARSEPGHLQIQSKRIGEMLQVTIQDDGPGIPNGFHKSEGIGLHNTRSRLQHLYGTNYRFSLENIDRGGVLVTIEIPFKTSGRLQE